MLSPGEKGLRWTGNPCFFLLLRSILVAFCRSGSCERFLHLPICGTTSTSVLNNSQAFTVRRKKNGPFFFLDEPLPGAPRHVCTKFSANIRRTDCVGPIWSNIKSYLRGRAGDTMILYEVRSTIYPRFFVKFVLQQLYCSQYNRAAKARLTANGKPPEPNRTKPKLVRTCSHSKRRKLTLRTTTRSVRVILEAILVVFESRKAIPVF